MRITYNSPVVLTFTFISVIVLAADNFLFADSHQLMRGFFVVGGSFNFLNPLDYLRIFSHAIGHSGWPHLIGNFTFILLLGPLLEEKYSSKGLLLMMLVTAGVTGILNVLFFDTGLLGASGIVFMMIILGSITNLRKGELPLTFILITFLYLGQEIVKLTQQNNISEFAHIIGGICGGVFGLKWVKEGSA